MSAVRIVPSTIRDATYVAAHMRPADWIEIECQCAPWLLTYEVAVWSLAGREAWAAHVRGQPVAIFGVHPLTAAGNVLSVWAWGTAGMWRAVPTISRFILNERVPAWIEAGVTRVEARSDLRHTAAGRWMRALGAAEEPLPMWGRDRQPFVLFWWTEREWKRAKYQS